MTLARLIAFIPLLIFASGCAVPKYESNSNSRRAALIRGEIKEYLVFNETQAKEAEKNANAGWHPQQNWAAATASYQEASAAALLSGQLQKSIELGEKSLEMADRSRDSNLQLSSINRLIGAYRSVRNFDKSRALVEKGFGILEKTPYIGIRVSWGSALYLQLGHELMRDRLFEKAIEAFSQSLSLEQQANAKQRSPKSTESGMTNLVDRQTQLAHAYRRAGRSLEAVEQYQRAFTSIKEWGLKYAYESDLYSGMAEAYLQQRNFSQALNNYQKVLAFAENQRRPAVISSASLRIGFILQRTGKLDEAIPYYQKAILQSESTRSLLQSEEYRQSFFEGALNSYVGIVTALLEANRPEDAFSYSERARARAFLDLLGSKAQLSRLKGGLLEEERALQERIAAIRARLSGEEEDGGTNRAGLGKELTAAEQAYNSFLAKVRSQDKEQASLMSVEPLTLKQVQELIDPGQTLLEYFVTNTEVLVWVVEKDKLNLQRVALSKNELAKQVKSLREMISTLGDAKELNEVLSSLYKSLIQPLLPHITGKELIIVPHDVLHYLPFQALLSADGRYLIEKYPINYLSSASLLQFTKEKSRAMGDKVLVLGNPDLGDRKMNLEFAEIEAKEIKSLYPQSTIFLAKDATEERAKTLSPTNDIIHFASHAELSEDDPLASAIRLAKSDKEDGRLEVREIFGMDLKANLVVLSACETGLGKLSSGDELVGLTRAFIYAGTPSVVASLWNVEDSSTAQLMASFYKNLKTMTKVEALRQAQLKLIRGNVNSDLLARRGIGGIGKLGEVPTAKPPSQDSISISTSHPFFWAPFILVGEGK